MKGGRTESSKEEKERKERKERCEGKTVKIKKKLSIYGKMKMIHRLKKMYREGGLQRKIVTAL